MLIRIARVETRSEDAWFDLSLRQLRRGEVNFYCVKDLITGDWLFKFAEIVSLERFWLRL